MRVLMLNHNVAFRGGGTFYITVQIGQQLVRRGHQVTIIASSAAEHWRFQRREINGIALLQAPGILPTRWRYGYDLYETWRRVRWVSQHEFDIVHAFESRPVVIYPALVAQRRGARLVMHWGDWFGRGGAVEQRPNPLWRTVLRPIETYYEEHFRRRADATTVINSTLEKRALGLGVPAETMVRLPHVSDPETVRPQDRAAARAVLGLPAGAPILGYVGALFADDAALMIDAFARIRAAKPEAKLVLIGDPKTKVRDVPGLIRTGFISSDDLNRYLAACDVLCLPLSDSLANRGRYPSKVADYFSAGRPTVACAVGEIAAVLETAQAGLLSEPTATSFADQALVLLENAELRERLGKNARGAAETFYNWATVSERVLALYLRLSIKNGGKG